MLQKIAINSQWTTSAQDQHGSTINVKYQHGIRKGTPTQNVGQFHGSQQNGMHVGKLIDLRMSQCDKMLKLRSWYCAVTSEFNEPAMELPSCDVGRYRPPPKFSHFDFHFGLSLPASILPLNIASTNAIIALFAKMIYASSFSHRLSGFLFFYFIYSFIVIVVCA